jgi:hypothetical protein
MCIINPNPPMNNVNTGCGDDNVHISKADGLLGLLGYNRSTSTAKEVHDQRAAVPHPVQPGAGNDTLVVDTT